MPTDRLYYSDSYLTHFTGEVTNISPDGLRVYLAESAFYPTSGGQPNDLGTLNDLPIVDIVDEELGVCHILSTPLREQSVLGVIDWRRRYDHMQQHTGQHLLSAVFDKNFSFRTLSFHMGAEVSSIELAAPDLSDAQIDETEVMCSRYIAEARPVLTSFEEAETVGDLRKPSARSGTLRIIEIEGLDRSACGGTHVRSTSEIGLIQIRRIEKIRGNLRFEFVCGLRAQRRAKQDYRILSELARGGTVSIDALPEQIAAIRTRLAESDKERQRLALELARREGDALYETTAPSPDGLRRLHLDVPCLDETMRAKAQAFASHAKAIILVVGADPATCLIACSADAGVNAGDTLKKVLSEFGARGGGSPALAQGRLPDLSVAKRLEQALCFDPATAAG